MIYKCKICGKHWIDNYPVKNNNRELFKKGLLSHIEVKEEINNPTNIEEYFDIYENNDERIPSCLINF